MVDSLHCFLFFIFPTYTVSTVTTHKRATTWNKLTSCMCTYINDIVTRCRHCWCLLISFFPPQAEISHFNKSVSVAARNCCLYRAVLRSWSCIWNWGLKLKLVRKYVLDRVTLHLVSTFCGSCNKVWLSDRLSVCVPVKIASLQKDNDNSCWFERCYDIQISKKTL